MFCFIYGKLLLIPVLVIILFCSSSTTFGSPLEERPDGSYYVKFLTNYQEEGFTSTTCFSAEGCLKEIYARVALEGFKADLSKFYTVTMGTLVEYQKRIGLDEFQLNSAGKCVKILNDFVAEKSAIALGRISHNQSLSEDPLVNQLIENLNNDSETKALRTQLKGIAALAESSSVIHSSNSRCDPRPELGQVTPISTISATLVGAILFWYGSDYLTSMTETILPYFWLTFWKKEIPAIGSSDYEFYYAPLRKCTMIVIAPAWATATSMVTWGTVNAGRWSAKKFHNIYRALIRYAFKSSNSSRVAAFCLSETELLLPSQEKVDISVHSILGDVEGADWLLIQTHQSP